MSARRAPARGPGRPTELTPAVEERLALLIARGNYLTVAARACGVDPATVRRWIAKGAAPDADPVHRHFRAVVARARAEAEEKVVGYLLDACKAGDPRAIQLFLQQRFPKRWRRGDGAAAAGAALTIPAVLVAPRPDEG